MKIAYRMPHSPKELDEIEMEEEPLPLLTLSAHAREGYSSHFVCLSVCHFFILEKAPFSGLKLTSVHSR